MTYEELIAPVLAAAARPVTLEEYYADAEEAVSLIQVVRGQRALYDPSQPRAPKGSSEGGQWVDDAGRTFTDEDLEMGADIGVVTGEIRRIEKPAAPAPKQTSYPTDEELEAIDEDPSLMTAEAAAALYAANLDISQAVGESSSSFIKSGKSANSFIYGHSGEEGVYAAAAARLVDRVRTAPPTSKVLYRGLGGTAPIDRLESLKPGQTLTIDRITSFSESAEKAHQYGAYHGSVVYQLQLRGTSRTLATDAFTGMTHREHVTHGKFRVVERKGRTIVLEQEATF